MSVNLYNRVRGPATMPTRKLLSIVLADFAKKIPGKGNRKYAQPNSISTQMNSLFSVFAKKEDIKMTVSDLKGFDMSFNGIMNEVYAERHKQDPTYGTKPFVCHYDIPDITAIDKWIISHFSLHRSIFDAFGWKNLLFVAVYALLRAFTLRGVKEVYQLRFCDFEYGSHEEDHPFFGHEYISINGDMLSKTNKLTTSTYTLLHLLFVFDSLY